MTLMNI